MPFPLLPLVAAATTSAAPAAATTSLGSILGSMTMNALTGAGTSLLANALMPQQGQIAQTPQAQQMQNILPRPSSPNIGQTPAQQLLAALQARNVNNRRM